MAVTVTPTQSQLLTKIKAFIADIVPVGVTVIQGLGNRAAIPSGPFVAMTVLNQRRLATNDEAYTDDYPYFGSRSVSASWQVNVQMDFYGPESGNWAAAFCTLFRDDYGCDFLAPECQPLYADTPKLAPWVSSEAQWVHRWTVSAAFNWRELVTVSQQFADALEVELVEVDAEFPPAA
jgi:hypothetical protein